MTNGIIVAAAAGQAGMNQQPLAVVTKTLATEVDQGRQALDVAVRWIAENGISFTVNLLVSVLLLVIGSLVIRMLTDATKKALQRSGRVNNLLENFLCSLVSKIAWILLFMIVIQRLGVNIAPLIAGLGVTGFIVGFAFQESLGNLAAGMMIAINHPFRVGDFVEMLVAYVLTATGPDVVRTRARYALFVESASVPELRDAVQQRRGELRAWGIGMLTELGVGPASGGDVEVWARVLMECLDGMILHRLTSDDEPHPRDGIELILRALL